MDENDTQVMLIGYDRNNYHLLCFLKHGFDETDYIDTRRTTYTYVIDYISNHGIPIGYECKLNAYGWKDVKRDYWKPVGIIRSRLIPINNAKFLHKMFTEFRLSSDFREFISYVANKYDIKFKECFSRYDLHEKELDEFIKKKEMTKSFEGVV
jgi:hypothetical protein